MANYVMKFGGTSLNDAEAVEGAYRIVTDFYEKNKPEQLIVVASAAGKIGEGKLEDKITNLLENIHRGIDVPQNSKEIESRTSQLCGTLGIPIPAGILRKLRESVKEHGERRDDRSYSALVSFGELLSVHTLSEFFRKKGTAVNSFNFNEFGMIADRYVDAYATKETTVEIEKKLNGKKGIMIVPGFVGYTKQGDIATFGRDGSNYSATQIGEAILAEAVYIFNKEQPGVRRAPPHFVPDAEILEQMTYNEAIEFADLGAKIINAKSVGPAQKENIPIHIVNEQYLGTKIQSKASREHMGAKIIAWMPKQMAIPITIPRVSQKDRPGIITKVTSYFADEGINIEEIVSSGYVLETIVSEGNIANLGKVMIRLRTEGYIPKPCPGLARVSLIGEGMEDQVGIIGRIGKAYQDRGVSIKTIMQTSTQHNITTLVDEEHERIAVKALYDEFFRNNEK